MAKRIKKLKKPEKTTFRELTEADRESYWYVEVPDDRPTTRRNRISEEEWRAQVDKLITTMADGTRACCGVFDDVVVGTPEWRRILRGTAMASGRRLFWEPKDSVGLTPEGAVRYGLEPSDADCFKAARKRASGTPRPRVARPAPSVFD